MSQEVHVLKNGFLFGKLFSFLLAGLALRSLLQNAPSPENSNDLWFALPAFAVFFLFLIGIASWAGVIRKKIGSSFRSDTEMALFDLSVGSVLAYVSAYLLTVVGIFSSNTGWFLWVFLAAGFSLSDSPLKFVTWMNFKNKSITYKLFLSLVPIVVIGKLMEGIQFHQHGDAYVTYLVAPRLWADKGNFNNFLEYSQLFLSTSWESLFAWGTALMGLRGGAGLDISQWFSQWVTGGIALYGCILAGIAFCERMAVGIPLPKSLFPVMAIWAAQVPTLRWTQNLAKNDMGIVFWGMSAYFFASNFYASAGLFALIAGVLIGAAVVGKFTIIFFGVLLSLVFVFRAGRNAIWFIVGGLIGSMPIFIRNHVMTGNPVFPWLPHLFPSPYLSEFALNGASAATTKKFLLADLPYYYSEFSGEVAFVLVLVLFLVIPKYRRMMGNLTLIPIISAIAFTIAFRPSTGIRYQNVVLVLLSLFSVYFLFQLIQLVFEKLKIRHFSVFSAIAGLVMVGLSNLTLFTYFQIGNPKKFKTFSEAMKGTNQIGGPAKVWIRNNIEHSKTILSFGDVHIYYLADYRLTDVGQSVEYGKKIFVSTVESATRIFKNAPFDYLYLAGEDYYKDATFAKDQAKIEDIMKATAAWNQGCKKFDNSSAQVWDLKCIQQNPGT